MINEGTNNSAPQNQVAQNVSSVESTPSENAASVNTNVNTTPTEVKETTPEKTFTRDELAKITDRTKRETEEKVRKEVLSEMQRKALESAEQLQMQSSVPNPSIPTQQQQGGQYLTREDLINLQRKQAEDIQKKIDSEIANSFMQKIELAKQENPDFDKDVMTPLNVGGLPMPIVNLLNSVDNVGDVLKEMAERPSTFTEVMNAYAWNPELARKALYKLSNSIKANKDAIKQPKAEPPLSQIKPSPTGKDSGKLSIQELRKLPQYRV